MFSDTGGGRAHQHNSKMGALPDNVLYVMLLCLPLLATAASTRSPRSCHLTVAGDRIALPASMTRRPAVVAGPVDSAGTPQSAYTTGGQASAPCQHSYRASILRGTDQHELPWLGNAVPTASSTPSTSSGSGGIRQSDGLLRVARRRRFHVTLGAIGSRLDHEARITLLEASRRRARSPRHGGMVPAIQVATGAPTTDRVITSKLALPQGCLQQHQGGTWSCPVRERFPGLSCVCCPLVAKSLARPIGTLSAC